MSLHEVEKIEARNNVFVVNEGKSVSSKDSAEFMELGGGGDASEFLDDAFINLVIKSHLPLD